MSQPFPLLPHHAKLLKQFGISAEVQQARGYRSFTNRDELARLGFSDEQQWPPALVIPILDANGKPVSCQIRPDRQRHSHGMPLEYEVPKGRHLFIDFPPTTAMNPEDSAVPLYITNNVLKADAAASKNLFCIALLGDWCWSRKEKSGDRIPLPGWSRIKLDIRTVASHRSSLSLPVAVLQSADAWSDHNEPRPRLALSHWGIHDGRPHGRYRQPIGCQRLNEKGRCR